MPLTEQQTGPGNRIKTDDGERDIVARVQSDVGTLVVLNNTDGTFASVENEGALRDREDAEHVSLTHEAKTDEANNPSTDPTDSTDDGENEDTNKDNDEAPTPRPRRRGGK